MNSPSRFSLPGLVLIPTAALLLVVVCAGCGSKETITTSDPSPAAPVVTTPPVTAAPVRETSFQSVTAQLDPGGTLYAYLSLDQWLAGFTSNVGAYRQLIETLPELGSSGRATLGRGFDLASNLFGASGLELLDGVGLSGLEVAPGLFRTKLILHHAPGGGDGLLWKLMGTRARAMEGLNLLPPQTALASFGEMNLMELWGAIHRELSASGFPQAAEMAAAWPALFKEQSGLDWTNVLASFTGRAGFVLTLNESNRIQIPIDRRSIEVPEPGLMMAIQVNNELVFERVLQDLSGNAAVTVTNEGNLKLAFMPLPLPMPLPLELVVASSGDHLFVATSRNLVRDALAVRDGRMQGAKDTAEFRALAAHLQLDGNQFSYTDRRLSETIAGMQTQIIEQENVPDEHMAMFRKLFLQSEPTYGLGVASRTAEGWSVVSVGNQDSATMVLVLPAVGASAFAAGLILPALAKAKAKAQAIRCVSQLKSLGLAARIYANDRQGQLPPAATWADAMQNEIGNLAILRDPSADDDARCHYAFNAKLSGRDESTVNPQTVMFFETEGGWNQHGGRELLLAEPRHSGLYVIGFADGSVQQVPVSRMNTLRWDP